MARRKSSGQFIKGAIKRPGALSARAKRSGRSTTAQARRDVRSGTPLQKRQGNFYLNVLSSGSRKSGSSSSAGKRKRRAHTVKAHNRTLSSGKSVRVKRHRRSKRK